MNFKKISETLTAISSQNLTSFELHALGKMLTGASESMIYKEMVDEAKSKSDYSMLRSERVN